MQTVTSCFIRKVKLYLNVLKSFHTDFHNTTKFKKRLIKSVRYIVFSIFRILNIYISFQTSKNMCDTYIIILTTLFDVHIFIYSYNFYIPVECIISSENLLDE
jgi:hypothetical protein